MIQDILFILLLVVSIIFILVVLLLLRQVKKLKICIRDCKIRLNNSKTFIDADDNQIYMKDEHLKYIFVNKAFCDFVGKTESEIIGFDDFSITDEERAKKRRKTDFEALEKKEMIQAVVELRNQLFKVTKFPVHLLNGQTGIGAYVRNITEEYNNSRKLQKTLQRNNILLEVINSPFETTRLQLDYVLHEALKLTESKFGYIYLYNEEKDELMLNTWSSDVLAECGIVDQQITYKLKDTGLWGEAVRQRKPIVVNDFNASNPLKKGYPEGHIELKKFVTLPVVIDEKIVAVVGLANKEEDYDENDIFQMSLLMSGAWSAKERKEAQEKLNFERNKYLQTLLSIGDGVMVVDKQGNIEMLNAAAQELTGWSLGDALGKQYSEVFKISHENKESAVKDPIRDVFITDMVQELGNHAILTSKNGDHYSVEDSAAPIRDEQNNMVGVVLVFRDVTEKKEQRREIEFLSFHDPLTGLYNRRFFEEAMLRLDTVGNIPISVIMGDVNGLKLTNDVFGHAYGDILLKKVSEVLQKASRDGDIVARFGGDEFVILLPKTGREAARQIIMNIKAQFEMEHVKAIKGSISMGTDTKLTESDHLMQVLENAEEKMYLAKTLERKSARSAAINEIVQTLHQNSETEKMHALHVSALCYEFARTLNLPDDELRKLKDAGFLHDIGKIVLETQMLNYKNMPSSQEWATIKRHPIIGFRILNAFDETLDLAEAVLAHHERWDGKGYPKGLKGDEIPEIARIISLAESYDKILSACDKPMQEANQCAINAIRNNAGTQFDPILAEAFIRFAEQPKILDADSLNMLDIRF